MLDYGVSKEEELRVGFGHCGLLSQAWDGQLMLWRDGGASRRSCKSKRYYRLDSEAYERHRQYIYHFALEKSYEYCEGIHSHSIETKRCLDDSKARLINFVHVLSGRNQGRSKSASESCNLR